MWTSLRLWSSPAVQTVTANVFSSACPNTALCVANVKMATRVRYTFHSAPRQRISGVFHQSPKILDVPGWFKDGSDASF